jgi:hypothetical protein
MRQDAQVEEMSMAAQIRLRTRQFDKFCKLKGWLTQAQRATGIGVTEPTIGRVMTGKRAPGEQFIAGCLAAFPDLDFDDLFEVIAHDATDQVPA